MGAVSIFERFTDHEEEVVGRDAEHDPELADSVTAASSNTSAAAQANRARAIRFKGVDNESAEAMNVAEPGIAGSGGAVPYQDEMESKFGTSLDGVRAHTGDEAAEANRVLGAEAFTYGSDIAFRTANPSRETVAHELTHSLQQTKGGGAGSRDADERIADHNEANTNSRAMDFHGAARAGGGGAQLRFKKVEREEISQSELADAGKDATLDDTKTNSAITFNNKKWKDDQRRAILEFLTGGAVTDEAEFTTAAVRKVAKLQAGSGLEGKDVDGKIGDKTMAMMLHAGLTLAAPDKFSPSDVVLLFYPGEFESIPEWEAARESARQKYGTEEGFNEYRRTVAPDGTGRIYVKVKGNMVAKMEARGGPPVKLIDGTHTADPSRKGKYKLGGGAPYRTNSWYNSQIRWGAEIREKDGQIQFKDPGSTKWKWATGSKSQLKSPMKKADFDDGSGGIITTWEKNDFGPIAWRVQGSPGLFVHTSPQDERVTLSGRTPELTHSHGCLHVQPAERTIMQARGYLVGATMVIKGYDEHMLAKPMRERMEKPKP
jgi:hypothetical protein